MSNKYTKRLILIGLVISISASMTACSGSAPRSYHVISSTPSEETQSVVSSDDDESEENVSNDVEEESNISENEDSQNESSETVSSESVSSKENSETSSFGTVPVPDVIGDIFNSKTEPDTTSSSKEDEAAVDYEQMYNDFVNSGSWRTYESSFEGRNLSVNDCTVKYSNIFDLDGDGIPELLLYAEAPYIGPRIMSASGFYTIKSGKIVPLLIGSTCGGTLGGETISLAEESGTGKLYVGSFGSVGGFGGTGAYISIYDYAGGNLSLHTEYKCTEYNNSSLGTNEYKIDSVNVTKEEYSTMVQKYPIVPPQDVASKVN